jgi:hypothetical protein
MVNASAKPKTSIGSKPSKTKMPIRCVGGKAGSGEAALIGTSKHHRAFQLAVQVEPACWLVETRLRGWAYEIRTQKCRRKLSL